MTQFETVHLQYAFGLEMKYQLGFSFNYFYPQFTPQTEIKREIWSGDAPWESWKEGDRGLQQ